MKTYKVSLVFYVEAESEEAAYEGAIEASTHNYPDEWDAEEEEKSYEQR